MVGTIGRVLIGGVLLGSVLAGQKARAQPADARLDAGRFAASAPAETLLHVTKAGRFAISAQSSTGTALDLTDMITGPTSPAGNPGKADGRLDLLLDVGVYKIRLHPSPAAAGA